DRAERGRPTRTLTPAWASPVFDRLRPTLQNRLRAQLRAPLPFLPGRSLLAFTPGSCHAPGPVLRGGGGPRGGLPVRRPGRPIPADAEEGPAETGGGGRDPAVDGGDRRPEPQGPRPDPEGATEGRRRLGVRPGSGPAGGRDRQPADAPPAEGPRRPGH